MPIVPTRLETNAVCFFFFSTSWINIFTRRRSDTKKWMEFRKGGKIGIVHLEIVRYSTSLISRYVVATSLFREIDHPLFKSREWDSVNENTDLDTTIVSSSFSFFLLLLSSFFLFFYFLLISPVSSTCPTEKWRVLHRRLDRLLPRIAIYRYSINHFSSYRWGFSVRQKRESMDTGGAWRNAADNTFSIDEISPNKS